MTADKLRDRAVKAFERANSHYWMHEWVAGGEGQDGGLKRGVAAVLALPEVARALAILNYVLAEPEWADGGDDNCADCSGSGHNDLLARLRAVADGGDT